ncbi:magnesium transporter [Dethiosulfatibacter aminovorans DSM 17477]|uniref:Magnesium transporter n=1 Tax=Dethiosulfatibacter aminovorans DSM 17477 TaxID=1121476 RepID=A0A1M6JVM2_9FIRM|nr:CorA family divalent cation transporter [Dethiosulfatibacter aminovorans]SHJ50737.1 magnesium transporter [Dethiosulfatibacter aminovorans DSM 17477]
MKMKESKHKQIAGRERFVNHIPGTLIYKGIKSEPFEIECISFDAEVIETRNFRNTESLEEYLGSLKDSSETINWINITGINHVEEIKRIGGFFGIDMLVLEQILNINKHSMFRISEEYILNSLQMICLKGESMVSENISVYMKGNVILTFQEKKGDVFDSVRHRLENGLGSIRENGVEYAYFCLLDALVDNYMNVLERTRTDIDWIEEELVESGAIDGKFLHDLRKKIMMLRLSSGAVEKMVNELLRDENFNSVKYAAHMESLASNARMALNESSLQKETADGLFDNYMVNNSNDMNKIMTTLTIFSAVFIPLSFLAGVFGMNFEYIPGLGNNVGFYYFIASCIAMSFAMISIFKILKWF